MATIDVNGTTLYYEQRGDGPPLLFVSGALGDAGYWTDVADALADEYTVVTYDRRANSRSPRPENWTGTSVEEQADDAVALLEALDLAPAVVYGSSAGGIFLTNLALRRPDVLRGAIFHEPAYLAVTSVVGEVGGILEQLIGDGMAQGGPEKAVELFLRWVCGDDVYESFDPALRGRLLGNGDVMLGVEMEPMLAYLPAPEQLAAVATPSVVAVGVDQRDGSARGLWFVEASQWVADGLGVSLIDTPGRHVPQATHPQELVTLLRPILARLAASSPVTA
ncbi:alpha/beta fold hydrolase [Actinomycetospora sp. C-140]